MNTHRVSALALQSSKILDQWSLQQQSLSVPFNARANVRDMLIQVWVSLVDLRIARDTREGKALPGVFVGETLTGIKEETEGKDLILGVGPLQSYLVVSPEHVSAIPPGWQSVPHALLPLAYYLLHLDEMVTMVEVKARTRVIVTGLGLAGALMIHLLRSVGVQEVWAADNVPSESWWPAVDPDRLLLLPGDQGKKSKIQAPSEADLLVDTTNDPQVWHDALRFVRPHGQVLLLTLPETTPKNFNFYPYIHRSCLTLQAYPLGKRVSAPNEKGVSLAQTLLQNDDLARLISQVNVAEGDGDTIPIPMDRPGLVVHWPRS